jgi:hypothetical protein
MVVIIIIFFSEHLSNYKQGKNQKLTTFRKIAMMKILSAMEEPTENFNKMFKLMS